MFLGVGQEKKLEIVLRDTGKMTKDGVELAMHEGKMTKEKAFSRSGSVSLVDGQEKEIELDDTCHGHDEEKAYNIS